MKDYVVVSLSGGKDSTAMLLGMLERGEHIDEIVYADSSVEFPGMYKHIQKIQEYLKERGENIKFTTLKAEHDFEYYMFEVPVKSVKYGDHKGNGWLTSRIRWCTAYLKTRLIDKHFRDLRSQYNVIQCVGLAADEEVRLERKSNQKKGLRYPLVEWGWSEADCLEYCYSKGFDWDGLYKIFGRTSCWCCPLQAISELRKLWQYFPDLWAKLLEWDERFEREGQFWIKFKGGYLSVKDLTERFEKEKKRKDGQALLDLWF